MDIRKVPRSRSNPQFNKGTLPEALATADVSYEHVAALGGLRGKARGLPSDANGIASEISLQNLADAAGMSLYHFAKSFKQTTGCSPHRYLMEQRLRQARILLHDATLSIGDVARAVGFTPIPAPD